MTDAPDTASPAASTSGAPVSNAPVSNAHAYSVSELAFALKRTLEDAYGFVRLRGELSKVTHHASGHVYLTLKDEKAAIDGVVWKGQVRGLSVRPEQGLEVIVTGRITTFPAGSRYQIVIESMEAAGIGALLAQLERLKARLAAEGLFDAGRKQALPSMPAVVGVITSPTGAVIRDILHRIRDRWPCRVIVWPVVVQGDAAAAQVAAAIRGFNAMESGGALPRPDVLIIARGGGSVEDLWPFNDETLARTVAQSRIPLISAVGHETDTTLIDFVSDRRAPTPTAAAEMATPVLAELRIALSGLDQRLLRTGHRLIEDRRTGLSASARGLPRPGDLTAGASQRLDLAASRLTGALRRNLDLQSHRLAQSASPLRPGLLSRQTVVAGQALQVLSRRLDAAILRSADADSKARALTSAGERLQRAWKRLVEDRQGQVTSVDKLRLSLDPRRPLRNGFAMVTRSDGALVRTGAGLAPGQAVTLTFADLSREAVISGSENDPVSPVPARPAALTRKVQGPAPDPSSRQGDLF